MSRLILVLLMLMLSGATSAEIYKWVDDQGVVHYQDHPRGTPEKFSTTEANPTSKSKLKIHTGKPSSSKQKTKSTAQEQASQKKQAEKRKHDEKCKAMRDKTNKLEARMKAQASTSKHENPAGFLREQNQLIKNRQYLERFCN